ncbi:MAG TPA: PDZ domain-containing protein [Persephonella sp.]|uniref:Protease do n=1 Tax=Persephonella marina (strain DSM 14350 / EX-H1) TaxID=123214 RepID=C0QTF5_PERMH|nr:MULTISPECIES: trypsin-like peptidase domain-containing protein [Persephonella]ACO02983.1 protease do [Persephonella marina EX-H1]HCB70411.1 PDZ domain-containing protein [Persephonella sp.]
MHQFYILLSFISIFFFLSCEKPEKKEEKDPVAVIQERFAKIIQETAPSVVTILTHTKSGKTPIIFRFSEEPFPFDSETLGSGFVIKKDQKFLYIVTNSHVVEKSKTITVKFYDGYETTGKIVGQDKQTDIAVVKVKIDEKTKGIKPLKLGTTKNLKVGYLVISGGSPYNLGHTFTLGIISALNRNLGISPYENYIQTDAAINPGDSGGPLLDINGNVIGMNTAIIQSGQGLGFAIPIDTVKELSQQLIKYGKVKRGWLGVLVQEIDEKMKRKLNIDHGVLVIKVFKKSPAKKSGIKTGDIILSINGIRIRDLQDMRQVISRLKPEEKTSVEILRNRKRLIITVVIEEKLDKGN